MMVIDALGNIETMLESKKINGIEKLLVCS
jgi:hypothetical protein